MQGTFVVVEAEADSAVLRDVDTGQVCTLAENPGLAAGEVVEATLAPDELGVTYTATVEARREIPVERREEPPSERALAAARDADAGELAVVTDGEATVHALSVPEGEEAAAATEVAADPATVERAARLGARRVELRTGEGVLAARYRPATGDASEPER